MGPTLLIACLWGAVLVYWLWSRRPLGDPVGSFRHDLSVLGSTTPARVAPANRLVPGSSVVVKPTPKKYVDPAESVSPPVPVAAAARSHNRQELRRRRRDVIAVLALAALVTLMAAVLTGSTLLVLVQLLVDLVLGAYLYLLARATVGQGKTARPGWGERGSAFVKPAISTIRLAGAGYGRDRGEEASDFAEPSYGDFGSYSSLAISRGR